MHDAPQASSVLPTKEQLYRSIEAGAAKARPYQVATNRQSKPPPVDSPPAPRAVARPKGAKPKRPVPEGASADMLKLLEQANRLTQDSSKFLTKIAPKTPRSQQKAEYERALEKHREDALQESKTGGGSPSPEGKAASPNLPPSGRKQPVPGKLTGERLVFNVKSAALKGNANAQYRMAIMFHHGKNGVKTDLSEAVRFYMLAAGSGHVKAQVNVGLLYERGEGVDQSDAIAVRYFTRASEGGDAKAMYNLGMCYKNGRGVAQDNEEAVRWFTESAEKGNTNAKFVLGVLYQAGTRVEKNPNQAVSYYTAAAEAGDPKSMCNLGVMYEGGDGVPRNDVLAIKYFERAAENGDPNALGTMNIGKMCLYGRGGPKGKGPESASQFLLKAAESGNATAQYEVGRMYESGTTAGIAQDVKEARKFYRLASRQGNALAHRALGTMYFEGIHGVSRNYKVAAKHFKQGVDMGDLECTYHLGIIYRDGSDTKPMFAADPKRGVALLRAAAAKGHTEATNVLKNMQVLPLNKASNISTTPKKKK